jgi:UDP-N-acetylmuramate dehydrogenase
MVIGGGSNLLFTGDYPGTLLHSEIEGITVEETHPGHVIVSAGAGVSWDKFVEWCVYCGFGGIENLSLIPGSVGASAVQNIGAYGVEVKDTIVKVRAVSIETGLISEFNLQDCRFGYRNSIFKSEVKGKYLITKIYFRLTTNPMLNLSYGSLKEETVTPGGASLLSVRETIINIRRSKLPDPENIGSAGSFFKNPVVSKLEGESLKKNYNGMPVYEDISGGLKLAAGWLIDMCGWKGKRIGDAGVHDKQALVLVNYGKASGKDIYFLSEEIKKSVYEKFGVMLEREVEIVGAI